MEETLNNITEEDKTELAKILNSLTNNREAWQKFIYVLRHNIKHCYKYNPLIDLKYFLIEEKEYLILKIHSWDYLIIDLEFEKVLKKDEVKYLFDKQFFIDNFNEEDSDYIFFNDCKDCKEIIKAFYEYEYYLKEPSKYSYPLNQGIWEISFNIDLINDYCYLYIYCPVNHQKDTYFYTLQLVPISSLEKYSSFHLAKKRVK